MGAEGMRIGQEVENDAVLWPVAYHCQDRLRDSVFRVYSLWLCNCMLP